MTIELHPVSAVYQFLDGVQCSFEEALLEVVLRKWGPLSWEQRGAFMDANHDRCILWMAQDESLWSLMELYAGGALTLPGTVVVEEVALARERSHNLLLQLFSFRFDDLVLPDRAH